MLFWFRRSARFLFWLELLSDVMEAIEQQSEFQLALGSVPREMGELGIVSGAADESARAVLRQALDQLELEVIWLLYHDPRLDTFFLSLQDLKPQRHVEVEGRPWASSLEPTDHDPSR